MPPAEDSAYTAVGTSFFEPTMTAIPFKSATGVTIASVVDGKRVPTPPDLDNNEFFTKYTTNEVTWAGSGADGSGSVSFELQTVQQAPGLGCGTPVTIGHHGYWQAVLARGHPARPDRRERCRQHPVRAASGRPGSTTLPFKLDFKPTACTARSVRPSANSPAAS